MLTAAQVEKVGIVVRERGVAMGVADESCERRKRGGNHVGKKKNESRSRVSREDMKRRLEGGRGVPERKRQQGCSIRKGLSREKGGVTAGPERKGKVEENERYARARTTERGGALKMWRQGLTGEGGAYS